MKLNVLLVEDDAVLSQTLREALELEGYYVFPATTLAAARKLLNDPPDGALDLVLLDLGLPDGEGKVLLDQLRQPEGIPVLVISAQGSEHSKVGLFDAGADDYLVKPFSLNELLARMRAALRHRGVVGNPGATHYHFGDVTIDLRAWRVEKGGNQVHLTPTEFNLLARLVRSAGHVVTHKQLLNDVWGSEFGEHTHYLRLYMAQLRAKLEDDPTRPQLLHTETGVGYLLQPSSD
ncbi:MAG TPA: winged helix-turn-helix domain-containing protein [Candidatus Acidoferrum sp.]|nr:winged helix-turn-helix domain-containing protein [Candidatus Acidoferrum sp.]